MTIAPEVIAVLATTGTLAIAIVIVWTCQQAIYYLRFGKWIPTADELKLEFQKATHKITTSSLENQIIDLKTNNNTIKTELKTLTQGVLDQISAR